MEGIPQTKPLKNSSSSLLRSRLRPGEMQFVAFLLLATVPASLGVSSGAKAKLAFIEERMHARMSPGQKEKSKGHGLYGPWAMGHGPWAL